MNEEPETEFDPPTADEKANEPEADGVGQVEEAAETTADEANETGVTLDAPAATD